MATIFCFASTGNSLTTAKKLAEKLDGKVMPPKDSDALRQKLDESISEIAYAVNSWASNRIQSFTLLNKIVYHFYPNESSNQYFTVSHTCTGYMTCKKVCPVKNITMEDGQPDFWHRCEHCLACLHNCPANAIDWKQKTQGKERYRNAGVSLNDLVVFNNMNE